MPKFNLYDYKKTNGDEHIEQRLQKDHVSEPNEINEKQLEQGRADEPLELIEKLLEKTRPGGDDVITEKRLNDVKASFGVKNRNPEAFEGDMNKLEEKRLLNDPVEDEKYNDASTTPKAFRWWETKTDDGFKLASSGKQKKTAEFDDMDYDPMGYEDIDEYNDLINAPNKEDWGKSEDTLPTFTLEEYTVDNTGGTSLERGSVKINTEAGPYGMKDSIRLEDVKAFIQEELQKRYRGVEIPIEDESLELKDIEQGIITYMVGLPPDAASMNEEYEWAKSQGMVRDRPDSVPSLASNDSALKFAVVEVKKK